jgi:tetratricopeptide (TPR) repeat protein
MSLSELIAGFQINVLEEIALCLVKLDQGDEAQQYMQQAADLRSQHQLAMNPLVAGMVQAASGARVMENRIKQEEELLADDPRYWDKRAMYYRGRKEHALEEQAWRSGLAITIAGPMPDHTGKGHVFYRSQMLSNLAFCLKIQDKMQQAIDLLRDEIKQYPAVYPSVHTAVHDLTYELTQHLQVDDPILWDWLSKTDDWEYLGEHLLWEMLQRAPRENLGPYLDKAEKLTVGTHPSRTMALGWIENRMNLPKRSIPLLKDALKRTTDQEVRDVVEIGA